MAALYLAFKAFKDNEYRILPLGYETPRIVTRLKAKLFHKGTAETSTEPKLGGTTEARAANVDIEKGLDADLEAKLNPEMKAALQWKPGQAMDGA